MTHKQHRPLILRGRIHYPEQETEERAERRIQHHGDKVAVKGVAVVFFYIMVHIKVVEYGARWLKD